MSSKISIGIVSDTHLASKVQKLDELHDFYKWVSKYTNKVYNAGDILEGRWVYLGQENEVIHVGIDEQIDYGIKNYPKEKGLVTRLISGNHDLRAWEKAGVDMVRKVCEARDDMKYLGQYKGVITYPFGKIWLLHPKSGGAYAKSYPIQKYLRQMSSKMMPKILIFGHGHQSYFFQERDVYCVGAGCWTGENDYTIRRGLIPDTGGWLIEIEFDGRTITQIKPTWRAYK